MAKGTMTIEVSAETRKAKSEINQLQSELQKGLSQIPGLEGLSSGLTKLGDLKGLGGAAAAAGLLAKGVQEAWEHMGNLVERGGDAQRQFEDLGVTLKTISSNFGGRQTGFENYISQIQQLSANGVNSVQDLGDALKTLTVAYNGNVSSAMDVVSSLDDIAAGTGQSVASIATLIAKIKESGPEHRDMQSLARKGIPIWQSLANVMGTTAEAAKAASKEGKVSAEQEMQAVLGLKAAYEGLSKAKSAQTLEGARATYEAQRGLAAQGAAAGYSAGQIEDLNRLSAELEKLANDPNWQELQYAIGDFKSTIETINRDWAEGFDRLKTTILGGLIRFVTQDAAKVEREREARYNALGEAQWQETLLNALKFGVDKNAPQAEQDKVSLALGQLQSSEQLRNFKQNIEETYKLLNPQDYQFLAEDRQELLRYLDSAIREAESQEQIEKNITNLEANIEKQTAQLLAQREAISKYGTTDQRIAALNISGETQGLTPENIGEQIQNLKNAIMSGSVEDMAQSEKTLREMQSIQQELTRATEEAARAEAELTKKREDAAKAAQKAEQELEKKRIEGKANVGREIAATQAELDTVNGKLERIQRARAIIADEEAHGIYREKWGDLNVADVESNEAEMLKAQYDLGKKLEDLKKKYDNWDKNWGTARRNFEKFFLEKLPVNVNWVPAG